MRVVYETSRVYLPGVPPALNRIVKSASPPRELERAGQRVVCPCCGRINELAEMPAVITYRCAECNEALPNPFTTRGRLRLWRQTHWVLVWWLMLVPVAVALGGYAWHGRSTLKAFEDRLPQVLRDAEQQHQAELARAGRAHTADLQRLEDEFRARIQTQVQAYQSKLDNAELISGKLARARHAEEWSRRLAHDPALAVTPLERVLLDVERVGRNPKLAAREALAQVIGLVAPPGSTNRILPAGNQFIIELAFRMSALSPHEKGAYTQFKTVEAMKEATVLMCAHIMRDLFDSCGGRGIRRVRISCNHAIHEAEAPESDAAAAGAQPPGRAPIAWKVLYRCSISAQTAARIASWRLLPLHKIADLMEVDEDGFQKLSISQGRLSGSARQDPEGPLKF